LRTANINLEDANLEENTLLLESLLAARLGEDRIHPLSIEYLRQQQYPGSALTIEETLSVEDNYSQYVVSYQSEGLKLYATMTVPDGVAPARGWPVVIFVHGYIEPETYIATERYIEHVDAIASNGYIVLRPDLRGHGASEGEAYGAYGDPGYTIDVLNALASTRQFPDADPNRIGMWGHSMGGYLVARAMVVSKEIKAGVIWAGVVAPYPELVAAWGPTKGGATSALAEGEMPLPTVLVSQYGTPEQNPAFWDALSANSYASDLSGPVQLHHGAADNQVPVIFSERYYADVIAEGQVAEYYLYEGDDHNLSANFDVAMRRSLEFFDTHMKNSAPTFVQSR
jgi:dipeptidyl aminopeptidase/acylaminoacyl peptidase